MIVLYIQQYFLFFLRLSTNELIILILSSGSSLSNSFFTSITEGESMDVMYLRAVMIPLLVVVTVLNSKSVPVNQLMLKQFLRQ